jgi:hypothetical protein
VCRESATPASGSRGGRGWAEFGPDGSVLAFSLPCRRAEDAAVIATADAD